MTEKKNRRIWSQNEIDFIKKNCDTMSVSDMSEKIKRSKNAVYFKINSLNLPFKKNTKVMKYKSKQYQVWIANFDKYKQGERGRVLYFWEQCNKKRYKEGTLSAFMVKKLQSIEFNFKNNYKLSWEEQLENFKNGFMTKIASYQWKHNQRKKYADGILSEKQIKQLQSINFNFYDKWKKY
jgi:hypothetical protein